MPDQANTDWIFVSDYTWHKLMGKRYQKEKRFGELEFYTWRRKGSCNCCLTLCKAEFASKSDTSSSQSRTAEVQESTAIIFIKTNLRGI